MSDIGCKATGYVYMYSSIFENAAFSMRLGPNACCYFTNKCIFNKKYNKIAAYIQCIHAFLGHF